MRGRLARLSLPLVALALAVGATPAAGAITHPVQDPVPISPNLYFKGLINGHPPGKAIIKVLCPSGAAIGKPAPHQTIEVVTSPPPTSTNPDIGFTGSKGTSIDATLGTPTLSALLAHFTSFFVKMKFPTNISVPCSGTGAVAFVPAPGSKTAHTARLAVTFGSITG